MIAFLLFFVMSSMASARPNHMEVWFVAEDAVSFNEVKIPLQLGEMVAESVGRKCRPIDEHTCFHPQFGVLSLKDGTEVELVDNTKVPGPQASKLSESDLIKCQKSYHFDLFCGKEAKLKRKQVNLELWIDTSSSMRAYDYSVGMGYCQRKSFVKILRSQCDEKKFDLSVFAGSLKSLGGDDTLCFNTGVNNPDRLISWIDASVAKNLIVITDTSQLTLKMTTYLKSISATIRGMEKADTLFVSKLTDAVKHAVPYCK